MATASTSHMERQLLPTGWHTGCMPLGRSLTCVYPRPHVPGRLFTTQGSCKGPRYNIYHALCVQACDIGSTHVSGQTWGDTHQSPDMCIPVHLLCRRPLLLSLGPLRSQLSMSLPSLLGLPGSSHCDSGQERLTPNWFEGTSESAQPAGVRDAL